MIVPILCPVCTRGFCKSVKKNKISYVTCSRCSNIIEVNTKEKRKVEIRK
jgi:hypothetical protein